GRDGPIGVVRAAGRAGPIGRPAVAVTEGRAGTVGRGGRTILRGSGAAGLGASGSGSDATTAVRVGSACLTGGPFGSGWRDSRMGSSGAVSAGAEPAGPATFSMILIRESALFCGRNALDSVSRTISCLGA